ncbi:MAG: VWA domain-containing protein [Verrucomicrobiota bacterium]|nr:VWA domain-containing protein [Verrucomicrobiota bacterium]
MNPFTSFGITFAQPWLLLLLVLVPVLAFLKGLAGKGPAVVFSSIAPLQTLGRAVNSKAGNFLTGLFFLALAAFIIALARPQRGKTFSHVEASGIDIMVLLDVSRSMLTEDFSVGSQRANRLDAIKQVTQKFIDGRPNDRIGIIAFAGRPYLVSPLTLDHDWLMQNLDRIRIGLVEDGTAIGSAIASGCNRLKAKDSKSRVLILLTDGDNNAGKVSPETAAEAAKAIGIKLYAIGAGTNGIAPYPFLDPFGRTIYQNVKVEFNEAGLKKVAQIGEGQFFRATDTRSLEQIYGQIDKMEKTKIEINQSREYNDIFPWFIGIGLCCLGLDLALAQTTLRRLP